MTKQFQPQLRVVKDKHRTILTENEEIKSRWRELMYFLTNRTIFVKRDKLSTGYSWLHQVLKKIFFQAILYTHEVYQKMFI